MKPRRRFRRARALSFPPAFAILILALGCSEGSRGEPKADEATAAKAGPAAGMVAPEPEIKPVPTPTVPAMTPEEHFIDLKTHAQNGDSDALYTLGQYAYVGNLSEQDFAVAANYFRQAAQAGHTDAMISLGTMYGEGKGVRRNLIEAGKLFKRGAERDNSLAQVSLAQMYLRGLGGGRPDYARALHWHQRAAQLGDPFGQAGLASQHLLGQGTPKDPAKAVEWFRAAAEQGLASAQVNLGSLYRSGSGVAGDNVEAYKWFSLAARQNDPTGIKARDALLPSLSDDQLAEADKRLEAAPAQQ